MGAEGAAVAFGVRLRVESKVARRLRRDAVGELC
jgi:hypothetical protein